MRVEGLLVQKGKARATYYEPGPEMLRRLEGVKCSQNEPLASLGGLPPSLGGLQLEAGEVLQLVELRKMVTSKMNTCLIERLIAEICQIRTFTRIQIADLLSRNEDYIKKVLVQMVKKEILAFTMPEMSTNPHQAYKTIRVPELGPVQTTLDLQ